MNQTAKTRLTRAVPRAVLTIVAALCLVATPIWAATQFEGDGVKQDPLTGKWVLPNGGACAPNASITTRPECVATIFNSGTIIDSATCGTAVAPGSNSWSTTANVCVDTTLTTAGACVNLAAGGTYNGKTWANGIQRVWNSTANACILTYKGYDRNKVTCFNQGGTYGPVATVIPTFAGGACFGVWVMPDASTFTPPLLNRIGANPSTGDQCLRCHRNDTQWNVNDVRWVDTYTQTGHRNMSRKSTPNVPQVGHDGTPYPTDSTGLAFDWVQGKVNGNQLYWIYDGWFEAPFLPASVANVPASGGVPGVAYSCARCHTTGWTSDAVVGPSTGWLAKEPEKSFPGISWDGVSAATNGQVNLKSGVAGDPNGAKTASWDLFGITCNRCHGAVVDNTSSAGPPTAAFTAPTGYGTHNNSMTGTGGNGYCSIPGPTASAQCTAIGGTWLTTSCSDGVSITQAACVAAGKVWTFPTCTANNSSSTVGTVGGVKQAYCSTPDATKTTSAACTAVVGGSWTDQTSVYTTSAACTGAGYQWISSKCQVCYVPNATYTTAAACAAVNISPLSITWTNAFATDVDSCIDAGGKWADTKSQRGQVITGLCTQCHRQETSGLPNTNGSCSDATKKTNGACVAAAGTWTETGNGLPLSVGPYHNTITFPSHFHGNQYLNSPHAKFTGKFAEIATAPFGYSGTGKYLSFFIQDGEAAGTGNGCTGCHNVHKSTDPIANPSGGAVKECTECHQKDLNLVQHPKGIGTPLEDPAEACAKCHMPSGQHSFRINVDSAYSTFPSAVFTNGVTGAIQPANTAADGTFANAVWVDLNLACGQCHGGGTTSATTTGSITTGTTALTVANATGFASGEAVTITGAALVAGQPADFPTYVSSVAGNVVTLVGKAGVTVTNAKVVLNPTKNGAGYISKVALAGYAKGMHNDKPFVSFTAAYGANGATVNVDASATKCSGSPANCNAYDWDWGDGSAHGSGVTASHLYSPTAPSQTFTITLTATQYSVGPGTATQKFTAYPVINRPTATGACVLDYVAWTATCNNSAATPPDAGYQQLVFDWGDGTVISTVTAAPWNAPVVHKFIVPGNYNIKLKVYDTLGQIGTKTLVTTVASSFSYSTISGTVFATGGVTPLGAAQIQVKANGTLVKSTMTQANGTYTLQIKPGTYTVGASKSGFTFPPATSATVPPAATVNITAN